MLRISLSWLAESCAAINNLKELRAGLSGADAWMPLSTAETTLNALYLGSIYRPYLKISPDKAFELSTKLKELVAKVLSDDKYGLSDLEAWEVRKLSNEFLVVLNSELASLPAFLVAHKENYDVDRLIANGAGLFPAVMVGKVPEAFEDAQEAGRCLAFEIYTACGFHTFRVLESVLRRYWSVVSDGAPLPVPQSIGKIASQLESQKLCEDKVYEVLKQVAKLHRNPIAHPEVQLSADDAIGILGMARSAITPMLQALPDLSDSSGSEAESSKT